MSRKPLAEPKVTLRDADIGSERVMTRRSLIGGLGLGAAAAGALLGTAAAAEEARKPAKRKGTKKQQPKKPPPEEDKD